MKLPKIKVREITAKDLEQLKVKQLKVKQLKVKQLKKAIAFYTACPFATKEYLCLQTKLSFSFVSDNWQEITKGK